MANIRIIDLKIRLGQPYVYMHQGCCEHLFVYFNFNFLNPNFKVYFYGFASFKCRRCSEYWKLPYTAF